MRQLVIGAERHRGVSSSPVLDSGVVRRKEWVLVIEGNRPARSLDAVAVDLGSADDQ